MKDLNTGRRIKSINYRGLIVLFLIFGFIICLTGNFEVTYGKNSPPNYKLMGNNVNEDFKEIKDNIIEQCDYGVHGETYFPMIKILSKGSYHAIISETKMDNFSFQSLKMLYSEEKDIKSNFKINKKEKLYKKEYKSKIFDKTRSDFGSEDLQIDYEENDPYIQNIAKNITKNLENPTRSEIAMTVYNWVNDNVEYENPVYYESKHYASQTAKLKRGNCCDQARLVIALCRAAGIPQYATEYHNANVKMMGGKITGHVWPVIITENGEQIICDTSCYGCSFGSPSWKNIGYETKSTRLSF